MTQHEAMVGALLATLVSAQVVNVADGDTLNVLQGHKVPERRRRPAGPLAQQQLQRLLPKGSRVLLLQHGRDRYGRDLAEVYRPSSIAPVNLELVQRGWAFMHTRRDGSCDGGAYEAAEIEARRRNIGLWGLAPGPLP